MSIKKKHLYVQGMVGCRWLTSAWLSVTLMSFYCDRYVVIIVFLERWFHSKSFGNNPSNMADYPFCCENVKRVMPIQYGQNLEPLDLAKVCILFLLIIFSTKIN